MRRTNQSKKYEQMAQAAFARGDLESAQDQYWFAQLGCSGDERERLTRAERRVTSLRQMQRRQSQAANQPEGDHA